MWDLGHIPLTGRGRCETVDVMGGTHAEYSTADLLDGMGARLVIVTWIDQGGRRHGAVPQTCSVFSLDPPVLQMIFSGGASSRPLGGPVAPFTVNLFAGEDVRLRARFDDPAEIHDDPADWAEDEPTPRLRRAHRYCECSMWQRHVGARHVLCLGCVESFARPLPPLSGQLPVSPRSEPPCPPCG